MPFLSEPFTPTVLLEGGTPASVDQNLSRLVEAGVIARVTRGVFVRPEISRFVGKAMPEPLKVAEIVAKNTGAIVQVHGAEAAGRLELTTQVPTAEFNANADAFRLELSENGEQMRLTDNHRNWGFGLCFLYLRNVRGCASLPTGAASVR